MSYELNDFEVAVVGVKKLIRNYEPIITLILLLIWVTTQQNWVAFLMVLGIAIMGYDEFNSRPNTKLGVATKYISIVAAAIAIVAGVLMIVRFIVSGN